MSMSIDLNLCLDEAVPASDHTAPAELGSPANFSSYDAGVCIQPRLNLRVCESLILRNVGVLRAKELMLPV